MNDPLSWNVHDPELQRIFAEAQRLIASGDQEGLVRLLNEDKAARKDRIKAMEESED